MSQKQAPYPSIVRLQVTSGGYRTKHDQAIPTDFIEEFTHI